nr:DUF5131 family protein [Mycobacterium gordonae]
MRAEARRASGGQVPASPSDVRRQENSCSCSPASLASFQRADPCRTDGESQERQTHGQSAVELGAVDQSRTDPTFTQGTASGDSESVRSAQSGGEVVNRASSGDLLTPRGRRTSESPGRRLRGQSADNLEDCTGRPPLAWLITGGESGPGARPAHPDWFRSIRDQCQAAGVAYLHKQWGEWRPVVPDVPDNRCATDYLVPVDGSDAVRIAVVGRGAAAPEGPWATMRRVGKHRAGRELDGRTWDQYPQAVTHA